MYDKAILFPPQGTSHKKQSLLDTCHESWVSTNTSNKCISHGNVFELINIVNA